MGRLVCLYIEDNEHAQIFVDALEVADEKGIPFPPSDTMVMALFAVPTLFCECEKGGDGGNKLAVGAAKDGKGISRGSKFGWWVHKTCGKPYRDSWQSPKNLIPPVFDQYSRFHCNWSYQAPVMHLKSQHNG